MLWAGVMAAAGAAPDPACDCAALLWSVIISAEPPPMTAAITAAVANPARFLRRLTDFVGLPSTAQTTSRVQFGRQAAPCTLPRGLLPDMHRV